MLPQGIKWSRQTMMMQMMTACLVHPEHFHLAFCQEEPEDRTVAHGREPRTKMMELVRKGYLTGQGLA